MYEILVGENPFKITKEDELIKIVKDAVVIPSYVELSHEAKDFLDCCLQKNPDQRSNIRELLNHSFFKKYPDKNDKKMGI
jgi:serine/threonine protein kinase